MALGDVRSQREKRHAGKEGGIYLEEKTSCSEKKKDVQKGGFLGGTSNPSLKKRGGRRKEKQLPREREVLS